MKRPFELNQIELANNLEQMIDVTFSDLESQFLVLPRRYCQMLWTEKFQAAFARTPSTNLTC